MPHFDPYDDDGKYYDDNVTIKHVLEPITLAIASISLVCSIAIIVTTLIFPSMLRKKPFMQIFFTIAICDLISNISFLFGYAHNDLCTAQGAIFIFIQRATFFWLVALTYQLYDVSMHGKLYYSVTFLHVIIWTASIFLELIILINDRYGVNYDTQGLQICLLLVNFKTPTGEGHTSFDYWTLIALTGPLFISIFTILFLLIRIKTRYNGITSIKVLVDTFWRYPLVLIILWTPFLVTLSIFIFSKHKPNVKHLYSIFDGSLAIIPIFGIYQSITFFTKSTEARYRWSNLLIVLLCPTKELFPVDFTGSTNNSINNSLNDNELTNEEVHKLSISRGFSFSGVGGYSDYGSENLSSITKSSMVLSSIKTNDSLSGQNTNTSSNGGIDNPMHP